MNRSPATTRRDNSVGRCIARERTRRTACPQRGSRAQICRHFVRVRGVCHLGIRITDRRCGGLRRCRCEQRPGGERRGVGLKDAVQPESSSTDSGALALDEDLAEVLPLGGYVRLLARLRREIRFGSDQIGSVATPPERSVVAHAAFSTDAPTWTDSTTAQEINGNASGRRSTTI